MIVALNHRVYTTGGEIYSGTDDLKQYNTTYPLDIYKRSLKEITVEEVDGILLLKLGEQAFPFSMSGFKSLCSLLKVPAAYLNKSISKDLVLQNLNNNPLKVDEDIAVFVRESQDFPFVSAVTVNEATSMEEFISSLEKTHYLMNNEVKVVDTTISNEEIVIYHLREPETLNNGQKIQRGFAFVFGEGIDLGFAIHPFYRIYFDGEDTYDFLVAKPYKRVSRKEKSYRIMIEDEVRQFDLNRHEKSFEEILKLIEATHKTTEISFSFLKQIKSAIRRTYAFQDGVYDTKHVSDVLLPEFAAFTEANKEVMKELPLFEVNNMTLPFYLPKLFSMFEGETSTLENPLFFNRQRRNVYKLMIKIAEVYYR